MSRSYKKNPYVTNHKRKVSKIAKRIANHSFRQQIKKDEEMSARPQHKKMTDGYDISDYSFRMTREDAIQWYENEMENDATEYFKKRYPTLESWLKYWEKCYRRK